MLMLHISRFEVRGSKVAVSVLKPQLGRGRK
jgi:hypothetical protein